RLIESLRRAFRTQPPAPTTARHDIGPDHDPSAAALRLAAAWRPGRRAGVKVSIVAPDSATVRGRSATSGAYMLMNGETGAPMALIDGAALSTRSAAAASALAAQYLARSDASRLLMVGAGDLAPQLIAAHCHIRPIRQVLIWNRTPDRAARLAKAMRLPKVEISATEDLEGAVRGADLICCATLSEAPLIRGEWLAPGAHLSLLGGFRPEMREADDDCLARARVFVDDRDAALESAGDLTQPVAAGAFDPDDIAADLFDLARGERAGRRHYDQITLFKAVGAAIEDLAAAELVYETA
ncbi:MAG: ornithine cyclodeaminase family protein, partial [Pseudomonadota bacterium]